MKLGQVSVLDVLIPRNKYLFNELSTTAGRHHTSFLVMELIPSYVCIKETKTLSNLFSWNFPELRMSGKRKRSENRR